MTTPDSTPATSSQTTSHAGGLLGALTEAQSHRNAALLSASPTLGRSVRSAVLPLTLDLRGGPLSSHDEAALGALEKAAAATAIKSLVSLARVNDIDHLGGGLELIPALLMTLASVDYETRHFTIEHGHTSIGYYSALAALGFLPEDRVVDAFRRSLDIAGHVSWVPGGTPLSSGRLGVMMPLGTGLALGLRARRGKDALVICHTGDAGWISGQALNGFVAASLHGAPITFVMHRNGIQLSNTTAKIMNKDARPIVASLGIEVIEIASLHDRSSLFDAYRHAATLGREGKPSLIYPTGWRSTSSKPVTVATFGERYGVTAEIEAFAKGHGVELSQPIWIPGSLMSFRDVHAMIECLFYVNGLPGGEAHHDGGMKGRDGDAVLAGPMLAVSADESAAITALRAAPARIVVTEARPAAGTPNLPLSDTDLADVTLPGTAKWTSPRAGSEAAYVAIAKKYPNDCFFVSCDLNPSTRVGKGAALVPATHRFELSIQEQAATLVTDGLSFTPGPRQLNVFATFAAFLEGIAREGFELWRYQRNLTGANEGLNVLMHFAHVGACTGRDHFSGWSLDWINVALSYLPYLRRFYAPADAGAAFLAVRDAAAAHGGHIVAIPRDNLPVLTRQQSHEPLWTATDPWTPVTVYRTQPGARHAILTIGAPSYLAGEAADAATAAGVPTDVLIVNGFPLADGFVRDLAGQYTHVLTLEDGLIGSNDAGLRGLAGYVSSHLYGTSVSLQHFGISDPQIAPSESFLEVWAHFGMTAEAMSTAILAAR